MAILATQTESENGFQLWRASFYNMPQPHIHTDIEIFYVEEGEVTLLHGGRIYKLSPHSWSVLWAGVPHRVLDISRSSRGFWLTLPLDWAMRWDLPGNRLTRLLTGELLFDPARKPSRIAYDRYQIDLWLTEFHSGEDDRIKNILLGVESFLRRIEMTEPAEGKRPIKRTTSAGNDPFSSTLAYISENYATLESVDSIAQAVDLHPKYLMQLFKKASGINLWEYVIWLRVAHAQRLLLTTSRPVIEIGLASGFNSSSAFYQAFKRFSRDLTPRQFRQQRG